jgi:hypothetical protein
VLDENPAGYEGPWETYARMITLRTPKGLTPIDYGIPALTPQAWYEACLAPGVAGARQDPARGLDGILALVSPRAEPAGAQRGQSHAIAADGVHRVALADGDTVLARKVVLATGIQGGGEWHTPAMIRENLPRTLYAHTSEPVDFAALKGKRIGILGGGASAFDNANHALAQGVGEVHVFMRRKVLPRINPIRFMERWALPRAIRRWPTRKSIAPWPRSCRTTSRPPTTRSIARQAGPALPCIWQPVEQRGA